MAAKRNQDQASQRRNLQKQRLQHQLEVQSMQIERIFDRHRVSAQVAGGTVRPRSIHFDLQTPLNTGLERLRELKQDLMTALGVADVQINWENGRLNLQVVPPEDPPVSLLDLLSLLSEVPPVTAALGITEEGNPVLLNFADEEMTHILLAGETNAGKTALLRSIAVSLALTSRQSQLQLLVLQPGAAGGKAGQTELRPLDYLPHLLNAVVHQVEEAAEILNFLVGEMEYRGKQKVTTPTIVVLIDKLVTLLEAGGQPVMEAVTRLAQRGAEAGIHLVLSTQRPEARMLSNLLKANLPVRIVGKVRDEREARAAAGTGGTQAEFLLGQGDFLAVSGEAATRFQAAYIGDYDLHLSLEELHRRRPPVLLAYPINMRTQLPPDCQPPEEEAKGSQTFTFDGKAIYLGRSKSSNQESDMLE